MTLSQFLTPDASGRVTLKKADSAPGAPLEALAPLFAETFAKVDPIVVTGATFTAEGAGGRVAGVTAWGDDAAASFEIAFDASQINGLTLKRKRAAGGKPWNLGVAFSAVFERLEAKRDGFGLHFVTTLETAVAFGDVVVDVTVEAEGDDRLRLDFAVEKAALTLNDILHLVGTDAHPDGDLQWLPEKLRSGALARIETLRLTLEPSIKRPIVRANVDLSFGPSDWAILPGADFPTMSALKADLDIDHPLDPDLRFAEFTLRGELRVTDNPADSPLKVAAHWPNLVLSGRLAQDGEVDFLRVLAHHGLPALGAGPSPLVLRKLDVTGQPLGRRKRFAFTGEVANPGKATGPALGIGLGAGKTLAIDDLILSLTWASEYGHQARIHATGRFLDTAGAALIAEIGLTAQEDNGAWRFEGFWQGDGVLKVGEWTDKFVKALNLPITLPKSLEDCVVDRIMFSLDASSHAMEATIHGRAAGVAGASDTSLELTLKAARDSQNAWTIHGGGQLAYGSLRFDLAFDRAAGSRIIAVLADDAPKSHDLQDVIDALGLGVSPGQGQPRFNLSLSFAAALAVFDRPASGTPLDLVAIDLGATANLTKLPLVGPMLGAGGGDFSLAFQFALASRAGAKGSADDDAIAAINGRLPVGATPVPPAGRLQQNANLSALLKTGDTTTKLDMALSAPGGGPAQAQNPPPNSPDGMTWKEVNKHFGPVHLRKAGFALKKIGATQTLTLGLDASLAMGPVTFALQQLEISSPLADPPDFDPTFSLKGLGLSFSAGGVTLSGAFLHQPPKTAGGPDRYSGAALISAQALTLSAIGEYASQNGNASVFVYAALDRPLGGPAFFFVTGLAAGFGYNRSLLMPPVDKVANFPLVSQAINGLPSGGDLTAGLEALQAAVPIAFGEYFLAVGIKFNSFKLIDSFVMVAAQFGRTLEFDLLGLSTAVLPPPEAGKTIPPVAMVQVALNATYRPDEGVLRVDAALTDASFLFSRACKLSGGFSFYAWFRDDASPAGPKAGEFVVSLGGYHPAFDIDGHPLYPRPARIAANWTVSDKLVISGDLYCALTPAAIMAGGHVSANFHDGAISAHFRAGVDFILMWKPYHYDVKIEVDIGGSYTFDLFGSHTINIDVGASLHIWGPEFSGVATVHLYIVSFDVGFGAGARQTPDPLNWTEFEAAFLPKEDHVVSALLVKGALGAPDSSSPAVVDPAQLLVQFDSAIPATAIEFGATDVSSPNSLGVAAMNKKSAPIAPNAPAQGLQAKLTVTATHKPPGAASPVDASGMFDVSPRQKLVPAALWGDPPAEMRADASTLNAPPIDAMSGVSVSPKPSPRTSGAAPMAQVEELIAGFSAATGPGLHIEKASTPSIRDMTKSPGGEKAATDAAIDDAIVDQTIFNARRSIVKAFGFDPNLANGPTNLARLMRRPAVLRDDKATAA